MAVSPSGAPILRLLAPTGSLEDFSGEPMNSWGPLHEQKQLTGRCTQKSLLVNYLPLTYPWKEKGPCEGLLSVLTATLLRTVMVISNQGDTVTLPRKRMQGSPERGHK